EYLMLGSIVAAGGVGGMVAMRDAMIDEFKEFGQTTREIRQVYTQQALQHLPGRKNTARQPSPYYSLPSPGMATDPAGPSLLATPHHLTP
ncbi:MAG: hypothetical protein NZ703_15285, partial [Gemmataceae bacterium]|nr:hypothetical protein [Gemmataceae bacterium]